MTSIHTNDCRRRLCHAGRCPLPLPSFIPLRPAGPFVIPPSQVLIYLRIEMIDTAHIHIMEYSFAEIVLFSTPLSRVAALCSLLFAYLLCLVCASSRTWLLYPRGRMLMPTIPSRLASGVRSRLGSRLSRHQGLGSMIHCIRDAELLSPTSLSGQ